MLALVAGEGLVRLSWPDDYARQRTDPDLGRTSAEFDAFDAAPPARWSTPRTRVLVLGDSYLTDEFRVGGVDQRFSALATRALDGAVDVSVFASSGWGTDQQLLAYLNKGRAWRPDVVVVGFSANDDLVNILSYTQGPHTSKPYFAVDDDQVLGLYGPAGQPLPWPPAVVSQPTAPPSHLLVMGTALARRHLSGDDLVVDRAAVDPRYSGWGGQEVKTLRELFEPPSALSWAPQSRNSYVGAFIHEDFAINRYQWQLLEQILQEFRDVVAADGARLAVIMLPMTFKPADLDFTSGAGVEHVFETPEGPFTFRTNEPCERLATICARIDVPFLDPCAEFVDTIRRRGLVDAVWPDRKNRHFSPRGHQLLAAPFAAFLRDELEVVD